MGFCRRTRRDSAALGMPPFAEKFEEQTSILEIQRYIDDLRQVVDPSWKPSADASAEGAASLAIEPESPKQRLQRQLSRGKDGLSRVKDSAKKKAEVRTLPTSSRAPTRARSSDAIWLPYLHPWGQFLASRSMPCVQRCQTTAGQTH